MNFEYNYENLQKYILECREKISKLEYKDLKLQNSIIGNLSESDELKKNIKVRNEMINTKFNHTIRVVKNAVLTANELKLNSLIKDILKNIALLHDIGRFKQYTLMSSGDDKQFKINNLKYKNHGDLGAFILFEEQKINEFDIPEECYNIFHDVIKYHGEQLVPEKIDFKLSSEDFQKIKNINTLSECLKNEKTLINFLIQLIRDIDMIDILFQYLTDDLDIISKHIRRNNDIKIENLEVEYGIKKKEILDYNNLNEDNYLNNLIILIPTENMPNDKLKVPVDVKNRILSGENINLVELTQRKDYTQVIAFWWRIATFINKISFSSVLNMIENAKLLEKIRENIPQERIELFEEIIDYAYEVIENKKTDNIYCKKTFNK